MNTETENTIESLLQACIDVGEQLRTSNDQQNPFYRHLGNLRGLPPDQTIQQLYQEHPEMNPFPADQPLPANLDIKYLGGFVSPVYKVTDTVTGEEIVLKGSNHTKAEYLDSLQVLANNPDKEQQIIGGHPKSLAKDGYAETYYELWPIQQGGDLVSKMDANTTTSQSETCSQWTDILIQTLNQLSTLETLETPLYMTDLKPGNIYFNAYNQVKFADLKGIMNVASVEKLNQIDTSPGYQPDYIINTDQPLDLKALSLYQLSVTAECFIMGQTIDQRLDNDELELGGSGSRVMVKNEDGTPSTQPYSPTFATLTSNSPEAQMVKMTMDYLTQPSTATQSFATLATTVGNLKAIQFDHPEFFEFIQESKQQDPQLHAKLMQCLGKGANSPEQVVSIIEKEMKDSRNSFLPFMKGQKYKDWRAVKVLMHAKVFRTNAELQVQEKYDQIFKHMQTYRDVQNLIEGVGGSKLSDTDKQQLYQDLDTVYQRILDAHQEYRTQLATSDEDLQARFALAEARALGQDDLYFKVLADRHANLMNHADLTTNHAPPDATPDQQTALSSESDAQQPAPPSTKSDLDLDDIKADVKNLVSEAQKMLDMPSDPKPSSDVDVEPAQPEDDIAHRGPGKTG